MHPLSPFALKPPVKNKGMSLISSGQQHVQQLFSSNHLGERDRPLSMCRPFCLHLVTGNLGRFSSRSRRGLKGHDVLYYSTAASYCISKTVPSRQSLISDFSLVDESIQTHAARGGEAAC